MDAQQIRDFLESPDDPKRVAELQKQFAAIWHANKCMKSATNQCTLPICPNWRIVLDHYNGCTAGYKCEFNSCALSRALIEHFNSCAKADCKFCARLRNCSKKSSSTATLVCTAEVQQHCSAGPSTSEFAASLVKGYSSGGGWTETACTAKAAYFSTFSEDFSDDGSRHNNTSSYRFITSSSSYVRRPYGKKERIQREIIVMLHVQRCSELEQADPVRRQNIVCAVPHCPKMKRTLIHVAMCQGEGCTFPECEVTRAIIQHWLRCPKRCCSICAPVVDSVPALDGGSHYEMDDKLLALLYTSTNGLIDIVSSDLSSFEENSLSSYGSDGHTVCYQDASSDSPRSIKRKFSTDVRFTSPTSSSSQSPRNSSNATDVWDKKRRLD